MGWHPVTDPSKPPMIGVRYLSIDDSEGYLAVRWPSCMYIYEGVPRRIFYILRRSAFAGSYFRKYVRNLYECVEIKKYDLPVPLELDDTPSKEKLDMLAKQRLDKVETVRPIQTNLFGEVELGSRAKRAKKRSLGG
jgi:KTSC domain